MCPRHNLEITDCHQLPSPGANYYILNISNSDLCELLGVTQQPLSPKDIAYVL